ncbi:MAG: hypothetical protein EZS28_000174 [Streblomastix strix]|uniref:Uncharacterized protein n=1 Tax=Streblomastix strix TaxID=222440 RepID=A0A5J4XAJ4_9EUKA|nr:MAG: hypothetical protein EZS28_000174 [Streblomastix strix]
MSYNQWGDGGGRISDESNQELGQYGSYAYFYLLAGDSQLKQLETEGYVCGRGSVDGSNSDNEGRGRQMEEGG